MTEDEKNRIDEMSYESLLDLWRNAPYGHSLFLGDTGEYYEEVMREKRAQIGDTAHTAASKRIGWE